MTTVPRPVSASQSLAPDRSTASSNDVWSKIRMLAGRRLEICSRKQKWIAAHGERAAPATTGAPRRNRVAALVAATSLIVATAAVAVVLSLRPPVPEPLVTKLDAVTPPTSIRSPSRWRLTAGNWRSWRRPKGYPGLWVRPLDRSGWRGRLQEPRERTTPLEARRTSARVLRQRQAGSGSTWP